MNHSPPPVIIIEVKLSWYALEWPTPPKVLTSVQTIDEAEVRTSIPCLMRSAEY